MNRTPSLTVPGRPSSNPLDVLNANLGDLIAAVRKLSDHEYVVIDAGTQDGSQWWAIACRNCSEAAGEAVHPCRLHQKGEPLPPPAISIPAQA